MKIILAILANLFYFFMKIYWFIFRPETRGVKVVIRHNDEILLIRHSYGDRKWTVPGGSIKESETPQEAATREAKEELGIQLKILFNQGSFVYTKEYKKDTVWVLTAEVEKKPMIDKNFEISQAQWFHLGQIPTSSNPALAKCLEFVSRTSGV